MIAHMGAIRLRRCSPPANRPSTAGCVRATPPFCELILTLSAPELGMDLSHFDGVRVRIYGWKGRRRRAGASICAIMIPPTRQSGTRPPHKFNEVLFRPMITAASRTSPSKVFAPSSWWVQQYRIPLAQQGPDLHHVYAIELATDDKMQPGDYRLTLDKLEFYGRWGKPGTSTASCCWAG